MVCDLHLNKNLKKKTKTRQGLMHLCQKMVEIPKLIELLRSF